MNTKGYKLEIEGNRSVAVGFVETSNGDKKFVVEFSTPIPNGVVAEEALTNHRTAKCNLRDGCMVTELILSPEGFEAFLSIGLKVAQELIDEGKLPIP